MRLPWGKKGKQAAKTSSDAPETVQVPALISFWNTAVVGVALVVLLACVGVLLLWVDEDKAAGLRELESRSDMLVTSLENRVALLKEKLLAWGGDPEVQKILGGGDAELLRAKEEYLASQLPGALRVRLFAPEYDARGAAQPDPLSYAGIDLLHQAVLRRRVTPLEVHRLGLEGMHLAIAGPVLDGETVLGTIHVSLPPSLLSSSGSVDGEAGRILFQQQVGDQSATVDTDGRDSQPEGTPDHTAEIAGTRLRVVAWGARAGLAEGNLLIYALGAYLVVMCLLGAVLWIPLRGVKRRLALDYAGIVAMVEDAVHGYPVRRVKCRLAETKPVVEVIGRMLRDSIHLKDGSGLDATHQATRDFPPLSEPLTEAAEIQVPAPGSDAPSTPDTPGAKDEEQGPRDEGATLGASPENAPARIFRASDIRGIVGDDLTPELYRYIGLAVGSQVIEAGERKVSVARDTRPSGTELTASLIEGLRATGCNVIDLGVVPTPLLYFATRYQGESSGVMVTGGHNAPEYNGAKVVLAGMTLDSDRIAALRQSMLDGGFAVGNGGYEVDDLAHAYIDHVMKDVAIARSMKVVLDCGNAAASDIAPSLYHALDCEVVTLNCDRSKGFPNGRVPDTCRPECLDLLRQKVVAERADLGLAFDGDGDRLGLVDSSGKIIWTDRVLMLLATDVLSRHPGTDVVFDVKCSHHLAGEILRHGGRPVMWKSGHAALKAKLLETGALLAGEWSGHILFKERWYGFDDALYAGARLLEVLALDPRPTAEVFAAFPEAISTPELMLSMAEGEAERIMARVLEFADRLEGVDVYQVDGLRVEFERGWGLVRASNTQPSLVFRFEADDESALDKLKKLFRKIMARAAPDVELPF